MATAYIAEIRLNTKLSVSDASLHHSEMEKQFAQRAEGILDPQYIKTLFSVLKSVLRAEPEADAFYGYGAYPYAGYGYAGLGYAAPYSYGYGLGAYGAFGAYYG